MRNTKTLTTAALILGALLASCGQQFYRSRPNDPPLLAEKGEARVTGQIDLSALVTPRISAAWSPARHLGLQAGYSGNSSRGYTTVGGTGYDFFERRSLAYAGAGYYRSLPRNIHFEVYGGLGAAGFDARNTGYVTRLNFLNAYLQPALALRQRSIELAVSLRYDYLHRGRTVLDTSYGHTAERYGFLDYRGYHFLQPGVTLRAGGQVKFCFEFYDSFVLDKDYASVYGNAEQSGQPHYSIGLMLNVGALLGSRK